MLDNITPAEYLWEYACMEVGQDLMSGKFAMWVPDECPFAEFTGKAVMVMLTEDGEYHVHTYETFEDAVQSMRAIHVPRVLH